MRREKCGIARLPRPQSLHIIGDEPLQQGARLLARDLDDPSVFEKSFAHADPREKPVGCLAGLAGRAVHVVSL